MSSQLAAPGPSQRTYAIMSKLLGVPLASAADVEAAAERGVSLSSYARLTVRFGAPDGLTPWDPPVRRCLDADCPLPSEVSEAVLRVAELLARAVEIFGDESATVTWFNTPVPDPRSGPPTAPRMIAGSTLGIDQLMAQLQHHLDTRPARFGDPFPK